MPLVADPQVPHGSNRVEPMPRPVILVTAQAQFPKSANKNVQVQNAFRPEDSTTGFPQPNGSDGWTVINKLATYDVVAQLKGRGYTVVNLYTGGTAWGHKDVAISALI